MIQEEKKKELMKELMNLSRVCDELGDKLYKLTRESIKCDERDTVPYSQDVVCWANAAEIAAGSLSTVLMKLYGSLILYNTDRTIDIDEQ